MTPYCNFSRVSSLQSWIVAENLPVTGGTFVAQHITVQGQGVGQKWQENGF